MVVVVYRVVLLLVVVSLLSVMYCGGCICSHQWAVFVECIWVVGGAGTCVSGGSGS